MSVHGQTAKPLKVLPRGRHAAPREVVAESQRERVLVGMADAVAAKGYANVAVADVIERAGVSRRSFYEHFTNKEDAFLAAYDAGVTGLLDAIAADVGGDRPRPADYVFRAAVGAMHELVMDTLLKHGAEALPELLGPLLDIQLRLLSGERASARAPRRRRR